MLNVIYLGPEGSYCEQATSYLLKDRDFDNSNKIMKSSIIQIIKSVDTEGDSLGIVPVENSIEGIVRETVDNLIKTSSNVVIIKELIMPIAHCLISKSDEISNVEKVISHPQALAQCRSFIEDNLRKNTEKISAPSTSEAVKRLAGLPDTHAAIGNCKAAEIYGFNILAKEINDIKENLTRFILLGSTISQSTGKDKTSIAFSTYNEAGALAKILNILEQHGINMSYIESRPSKKVFGDYTFFIDFDGHISDKNVEQAIEDITPLLNFYKFLGSYPKEQIITL